MVLRVLVVANALVCACLGGLSLAFVSEPAGATGAAILWGVVAALLALLPYTNPRRRDGSRW
jgi:hypothetical protein